jgi:hypothetical protein
MLVSVTCFTLTSKAYGTGDIKLYNFGGGTPTIRFISRDAEQGIDVQPFLTHISSFDDRDMIDNAYITSSNGIQGVDIDLLNQYYFEIYEITNKVQYLNGIDIYSITCDANVGSSQGGSWDSIIIEWDDVIIQPDVLSSYLSSTTPYENLLSELYFWVDAIAYWDITFRIQNQYGGFEYVNLTTQDEGISEGVSILPLSYKRAFTINEMNEFVDMYGGANGYIYIDKAICEISSMQDDVIELSYSQIVTDYEVQNDFIQYQVWYDYDNIANFGDVGESLKDSVSNFLNTEILPNFTILNILLIVIAIPLLIYILKLFLGG